MQKVALNKDEKLYLIRRFLFYYILFVILELQVMFVCIKFCNLFIPITAGIFGTAGIVPLTATAIAMFIEYRNVNGTTCKVHWKYWGALAIVMFGLWAGGYFLSGMLADPSKVHYLKDSFDKKIPFDYKWIPLYMMVYPFFLLPYFTLDNKDEIVILSYSYLFMLGISYIVFVTVPVSFLRTATVQSVDFPTWLINKVYGSDPPWNCLPSTHCGVAIVSAIALWRSSNRKLGVWGALTALLIGTSTLFTKQHYILDVIAGYALGSITYWAIHTIYFNRTTIIKKMKEQGSIFMNHGR